MSTPAEQFLRSAAEKSADLGHRQTIRRAIDTYDGAAARGRTRFLDWEAARSRSQEIKWEAVNHLDRYLLEFEAKVKQRGGHVFWAETSADARNYILDLAARRGAARRAQGGEVEVDGHGGNPPQSGARDLGNRSI